jgi:phage portal protein BeeE
VSLAGNAYVVREEGRLRRLQPDWVTIVLTAPPAVAVRSDVVGYWYHPGRTYSNVDKPESSDELYLPAEMCHWSPIPDPEAQYRGMSWLTPVVREVMADKAATLHKERFFVNGATLGPVVSSKENLSDEQFQEWVENLDKAHKGVTNAYKPLYLASPVDVNTTTADMRQLDFKITQGAGETRICAAGGVPPIIVGPPTDRPACGPTTGISRSCARTRRTLRRSSGSTDPRSSRCPRADLPASPPSSRWRPGI